MRNLLLSIFAVGMLLGAMDMHSKQLSNFTNTRNVGEGDLISKYKDGKVLLVRNDSTFIAEVGPDGKVSNVTYTDDLKKIMFDGQVSYGSSSGLLYYSCSGKIFTAKQKRNGKWVANKNIEILGSSVQRDKYPGSVLAYANWRYLPEDSIMVSNPVVNEDETVMYFASNMEGSKGTDIWRCQKDSAGNWGAPERLGDNINTDAEEDFPFVREDGSLVYASDRKVGRMAPDSGKYDLYVSRLDDGKSRLFADVFDKELEALALENQQRALDSINALNKTDGEALASNDTPVPAEVQGQVSDLSDEQPFVPAQDFDLEEDKFLLKVRKMHDIINSKSDSLVKVTDHVHVTAEKCIFYFEFDKDVPVGTYKEDFEILLRFVNSFPDNKFLIVGNTDERGAEEYNLELSKKRAEWVLFNLLVKGIKLDRLSTRGDGESNPAIKNAKTEEEHQINRRVEIFKLK